MRSAIAIASLASILILGFGVAPAAQAGASLAGQCLRTEITSPTLGGRTRTVRLYLPPSYTRPEGAARRYPVIVMLHGWPGSDGNWVSMGHACETADSMIARGEIPEVILVFPNGGGPGLLGRSMWMNSYDGRFRVEDYVVHDVVGWVDSTYRTRREPRYRGIIGLSDGGTAAVNIAFKHPDVFGACGSHSGEFSPGRSLGDGGVLGPEPGATRLLRENSPGVYVDGIAARLRDLTVYFDCGTDDEDLGDNRQFERTLTALGLPHTYREFPGTHEWGYWRSHLHQSLTILTQRMR